MINEKELKARMAGALELIKMQIPAFCEENGASKKDFTVATVSAFKTIEGIIDKLAAKGCWIPCSERLPEDMKWVLFNRENDGIRIGYYNAAVKCFCDENDYFKGGVTAWMPLPEPYKERNES